MIFSNTPENEPSHVDDQSVLAVERRGELRAADSHQLREVAYYSGGENPVTYSRTFKKTLACLFNLKNYPFDSQVCTIQLSSPAEVGDLVELLPGDLTYLGPMKMMQFTVLDWTMERTSTGLQVVVRFKRRFEHHLCTTFLPTFCLMLVCQSGLYLRYLPPLLFPLVPRAEHFKTTAAISVTVMLVMYTLYQVLCCRSMVYQYPPPQSVQAKVTPTAYVKLIDVWLIFGLVLPFAVFFLLVLIDHLPSGPSLGQTKPQHLWRIRACLVTFARIILPCIIFIFAIIYGAFSVVVYNS